MRRIKPGQSKVFGDVMVTNYGKHAVYIGEVMSKWEKDLKSAARTYNAMVIQDKDKIVLGDQEVPFEAGAEWGRSYTIMELEKRLNRHFPLEFDDSGKVTKIGEDEE